MDDAAAVDVVDAAEDGAARGATDMRMLPLSGVDAGVGVVAFGLRNIDAVLFGVGDGRPLLLFELGFVKRRPPAAGVAFVCCWCRRPDTLMTGFGIDDKYRYAAHVDRHIDDDIDVVYGKPILFGVRHVFDAIKSREYARNIAILAAEAR